MVTAGTAAILGLLAWQGGGQRPDPAEAGLVTPPPSAAKPGRPGRSGPDAQPAVPLLRGTVERAVDGDTAIIRLEGGRRERVRFIGVNTPELRKHQPYAREAARYTANSLIGRPVYLEVGLDARDRYGRLLAYIWLRPPAQVEETTIRSLMWNARLLLDGYAQVMTIQPNSKYADLFVRLQREAREAGRGLWGD